MTETREPTIEEQIAAAVLQGIRDTWEKGDQALTSEITRAILAIPQIQEGQELREKADRLVELDEDQSQPLVGYGTILSGEINAFYREAGFRRVKVKG